MIVSSEMFPDLRKQRPDLAMLSGVILANKYSIDMGSIFKSFKSVLPEKPTRVLDIGCGLGGIDVLVSNYYRHEVELHLLDADCFSDKRSYGYKEESEYYCDLNKTRNFLLANRVPWTNIYITNILQELFPSGPFDLIMSFSSWGFHYPISRYLDDVRRVSHPQTRLVLDLRRGAVDLKELAQFGTATVLQEDVKRQTVAFIQG
jgi:SAM-dependent methyltransferase